MNGNIHGVIYIFNFSLLRISNSKLKSTVTNRKIAEGKMALYFDAFESISFLFFEQEPLILLLY